MDPQLRPEQLLRYITGGKDVVLTIEMTVQEVNWRWDEIWERGDGARAQLVRFAQRCVERRSTPGLRPVRQRPGIEWTWALTLWEVFEEVRTNAQADAEADSAIMEVA